MYSISGAKIGLKLALRSQFFDFLRETLYKYALEHLEAAGPEKNVFFLNVFFSSSYSKRLSIFDLCEGLIGTHFRHERQSWALSKKKWLCHPLPLLFMAVSIIPNMWHSSCDACGIRGWRNLGFYAWTSSYVYSRQYTYVQQLSATLSKYVYYE